MVLGIVAFFEDLGEKVQNFLISSGRNPVVWLGLFGLGLLIFWITFQALNKNK